MTGGVERRRSAFATGATFARARRAPRLRKRDAARGHFRRRHICSAPPAAALRRSFFGRPPDKRRRNAARNVLTAARRGTSSRCEGARATGGPGGGSGAGNREHRPALPATRPAHPHGNEPAAATSSPVTHAAAAPRSTAPSPPPFGRQVRRALCPRDSRPSLLPAHAARAQEQAPKPVPNFDGGRRWNLAPRVDASGGSIHTAANAALPGRTIVATGFAGPASGVRRCGRRGRSRGARLRPDRLAARTAGGTVPAGAPDRPWPRWRR
jgi:hypothetical protein